MVMGKGFYFQRSMFVRVLILKAFGDCDIFKLMPLRDLKQRAIDYLESDKIDKCSDTVKRYQDFLKGLESMRCRSFRKKVKEMFGLCYVIDSLSCRK